MRIYKYQNEHYNLISLLVYKYQTNNKAYKIFIKLGLVKSLGGPKVKQETGERISYLPTRLNDHPLGHKKINYKRTPDIRT